MKTEASITPKVVFDFLGSLFVISVLLVVPYAIGYFAAFGIFYMSFFSVADYLTFAAVPMNTAVAIVAGYFVIAYLLQRGERPTDGSSKFLEKIIFEKPVREYLRPGTTVGGFWRGSLFVILVFLMLVGMVPFAATDFLSVAAASAALVIFLVVARLFPIPLLFQAVAIFLLCELLLFTYGRSKAENAMTDRRPVEITTKDGATRGYLAFAGSNSILLFDDQNKTFVVKLDGSARISVGSPQNRRPP